MFYKVFNPEVYLEPTQTFKMELFVKIVNDYKSRLRFSQVQS